MRRSLQEIVCCPVCRGDLELVVTAEDDDEVIEGRFRCAVCAIDYPIEDGIPNLLPPAGGTSAEP